MLAPFLSPASAHAPAPSPSPFPVWQRDLETSPSPIHAQPATCLSSKAESPSSPLILLYTGYVFWRPLIVFFNPFSLKELFSPPFKPSGNCIPSLDEQLEFRHPALLLSPRTLKKFLFPHPPHHFPFFLALNVLVPLWHGTASPFGCFISRPLSSKIRGLLLCSAPFNSFHSCL